jgi:lipopolysaccharide biosynthesis glycosyltransferase
MLGETITGTKHASSSCEIGHGTSRGEVNDSQKILRPIVMACDGTYAMQLATALRSAVDANRSGRPLDVHIFCGQFSASLRRRVADSVPHGSVTIRWVPVDLTPFERFSTLPHISKMTFARFMIPRIFSKDVRRALYLDADILVLGDLDPLWETDLKGAVVGAVLDRILDPQIKAQAPGLRRFPSVRDYFNAGVLLIDLDRWRKEHISETAMQYLTLHPDSPLADQDALNVACDGRWAELGLRWNFYDHFKTAILHMPATERPSIVHFTGQKPWRASALSLNADLYELFRGRTSFARTSYDKLRDLGTGAYFRLKRRAVRTLLGQALRTRYYSKKADEKAGRHE